MQRRDFITLLGGPAAAWPIATRAQQPELPTVGWLHGANPDAYAPMANAFRKSLNQSGYFEVQNVRIEYRWADGRLERLRELAADLVRRQVSVIFAGGGAEPALAAKAASSEIPHVFTNGVIRETDWLQTLFDRAGTSRASASCHSVAQGAGNTS
jgi:putative ABC transport system substrate-binding protein